MNEIEGLQSRKRMIAGIVTAAAWVLSSVGAVVLVSSVLDMILRIYAAFWGEYGAYGSDYRGAIFIRQILIMIFSMGCVVLIIGSAEYYFRNYGSPKTWKVISRILAAEAALAVLTLIV